MEGPFLYKEVGARGCGLQGLKCGSRVLIRRPILVREGACEGLDCVDPGFRSRAHVSQV